MHIDLVYLFSKVPILLTRLNLPINIYFRANKYFDRI